MLASFVAINCCSYFFFTRCLQHLHLQHLETSRVFQIGLTIFQALTSHMWLVETKAGGVAQVWHTMAQIHLPLLLHSPVSREWASQVALVVKNPPWPKEPGGPQGLVAAVS